MPESIVAYLVATIITAKLATRGRKKHLADVATVFSHLGVQAGLQYFSQLFTSDDLVRSQRQIRCRLRDIRFSEQIVVRKLPLWKLQQKIAYSKLTDSVSTPSINLLNRIATHASDFAGFSQILDVIKPREDTCVLSPLSRELLTGFAKETEDDEKFITSIQNKILEMRREVKNLPKSSRKDRLSELSELLEALRHALIGVPPSPKIEPLLAILGRPEAAVRIKKCLGQAK